MTDALSRSNRREASDRCPGTVLQHEAEDGLVARVRVPGGRLRVRQLEALVAAARLGNGLVDLTSRANVQVRGLTAGARDELSRLLERGALRPSVTHDRVRNVIASPVGGRHPRALAATDAVVTALDRGLRGERSLADLPGRFLFAVDDGSGLGVDERADVALVARRDGRFAVAIAGRLTSVSVPPHAAARAATRAAEAFLAARDSSDARAWRVAELPGGPEAVAVALGGDVGDDGDLRPQRIAPGGLVQRDGRVALTALAPLGRLDCEQLAALARVAAVHGGELRLSTERTVTLVDVAPRRASEASDALAGLGLVLSPRSGWVGLTACPGLGRCSRALVDVHAAAARRAAARAPAAEAEHWAACARRCGERAGQPLAVAALPEGILVRRGDGERLASGVDQALEALA